MTAPLWVPSDDRISRTRLTAFIRALGPRAAPQVVTYDELYRYSVEHPADFWRAVWEFCGIRGEMGERIVADPGRMPGAQFFPDARLNFAENVLRRRDESAAIVFNAEGRRRRTLSHGDLYAEVSRFAAALRRAGIARGDRVAGFLPNMPEAVIAALAAATVGAVWSSCSPDFGAQGVLDRFGQIEPKILIAADGYFYAGKTFDLLPRVAEIARALPTLDHVVVVPHVESAPAIEAIPHGVLWSGFAAAGSAPLAEFEQLPFNHPLYILYSSGTTGVPKCIVHGAGGTLIQHLKEHQLLCDVRPRDRVFYFTTCGWMMWNWLVSGLAAECTILLYDGSPSLRDGNVLFDFADATDMTVFGTSAKFIDAIAKAGLRPVHSHRLDKLRTVLSTGSPLAPEGFDYVYQHVKRDVDLASMSGGTDIIATFVTGNPLLPVWRGEIQCRTLGMRVEVFDDDGKSVVGAKGELVCTAPFPSMPVGFWNDPQGAKYRAAYFEKFPGVWCHGDYVELTEHDGMIIYGRSDAVLNPGGVRIGTAEIYRQVEQLDEIVESLVIGQDWPADRPTDVRIVLFVRLRDGLRLDAALIDRIKQHIRANTTPRHVPARVVQVTDIPRTKSGKIVELAVRHVVHHRPVKNREALANPEALDQFRDRAELTT